MLRIGPNPVTPPRSADVSLVHGLRAWCTACGSATARPSGTATGSSATTPSPKPKGWPTTPGPRHGMGDGTANTNVIGHAGRTFAIVEAGRPARRAHLRPRHRADDRLRRHACPVRSPRTRSATRATGELHAIVYYWEWDYVQYVVVGTDGRCARTVDVPVPGKPMMHDCAITETQVVVLDLPVTFDLDAAMSGARPSRTRGTPTTAHVSACSPATRRAATRRAGARSTSASCTTRSTRTTCPTVVSCATSSGTRRCSPPIATARTRASRRSCAGRSIPPRAGCTKSTLDDRGQEFPRHDERLIGRKHRYGYTAAFGDGHRARSGVEARPRARARPRCTTTDRAA